jgi:glycosyltransferase involved in cell wall biosynthesis
MVSPTSAEQPLRILVIVNVPWDSRLGAVRVYMELAERWRAAGHTVEHFSLSDAFANARGSGAGFAIRQVAFAYKAAAFVRRNGSRFDVIDAVIGSLHGSKEQLHFDGLLVARSVGLLRLYQKLEPRPPRRGRIAGRILYTLVRRWLRRASDAAVRNADLINLPNEDEAICLREEVSPDLPIVVEPYGLTEARATALVEAAASTPERLAAGKICFIGMWGPRKGSLAWHDILRAIWRELPRTRFCFLGTMIDSERILADLGLRSSEQIEFVPEYSSDELPKLLAQCGVALFPSYIEGFGLAVLEQLAAGIPTVAFDVPGPRQILTGAEKALLVPAGDAGMMARRATEILRMTPDEYEKLAQRCRAVAESFRWETIAAETTRQYRDRLARRGRIVFTEPFGVASPAGGGGGRIMRSLLRDAPIPSTCVSTAPDSPKPRYENELHLPVRPNFGRIERTRFLALPEALSPLFRRGFSRRLERLCQRVHAPAVHAVAHGGIDFHHSFRVARKLGIPFFLQVHDDVAYTSGGRAPRQVISRCLAEAWREAEVRYVVSRELGTEYNQRYGEREFVVVTDGVDEVAEAPRPSPKALRIYFMGLFHLEYEENLRALIDAVDLLADGATSAVPRSITLRCGAIRPALHRPGVRVLPFGSEADVQADFADADWLYLPLPFAEEHRAFVAYSLSTKMVTYLASGIPILYHGPPGTAVFNLLSKHRAAVLITTLDPNAIAGTLRDLLGSSESQTLAANALALARRDFLRRDQHDKFWKPILERVDHGSVPA